MTPLRVLSVTSEIFPLVKTGGLADVAGALPGALASHGVEVRPLVPGYSAVRSYGASGKKGTIPASPSDGAPDATAE